MNAEPRFLMRKGEIGLEDLIADEGYGGHQSATGDT